MQRPAATLLRWYYLATPAFWLADLLFHAPLRVAFLDAFPAGKQAWYAVCCVIGVVAARRPNLAPQLAFLESSLNVGLLILSVGVWYLGMVDWAAGEPAVVAAPTGWHVANFVVTAAAAGIGYQARRLEVHA